MKTILKRCPCYVYLFLLFMLCRNTVVPEQQTMHDTKDLSSKYTAFQAAIQAINQWQSRDIKGIVDDCTAENFKQENVNRKMSENNLRIYVTDRLSRRIDKDLRTIARNFFGNREEMLFNEMKKKFISKINKSIEENQKVKFSAIYKTSRKKAIDVQLEKLSENIYPDPLKDEAFLQEFENAFLRGWLKQDCQRIKAKLRKKLESSKHMLEEVKGLKEEIVKEILQDIRFQMETQKRALEEEPPIRFITRSQLQNAIKRAVEDAIERIRSNKITIAYNMPYEGEFVQISKEINRVIYGIFKFVDAEIANKARAKEKSRFEEFCQGATFNLWSIEQLEGIIRNDLRAHKNTEKSLGKIVNHYFSNAKQAIIGKYSRKLLQIGASEKSRFEESLRGYLMDPGIEDIVRNSLKSFLEGDNSDLAAARNNIAKEQLRRYFPVLNNKTWEVPKLSKLEHSSKFDIMREIKNNAGRAPKNPEDFFGNPKYRELIRVNTDREILLDNTETMVLKNINDLINEAGAAWDGQLSIYYTYRDHIEKRLKINPKQSKQELVDYYKKTILSKWEEKRTLLIWEGIVPSYGEGKYKVLFEYIEKEIDRMLNEDIERILKKTKEVPIDNDSTHNSKETGAEPGGGASGDGGGSGGGRGNGIGSGGGGRGGGGDVSGNGCLELRERLIETQAKLRETETQKDRLMELAKRLIEIQAKLREAQTQKKMLIWILIVMLVLIFLGFFGAYKILQMRKKW